MKTIYRILILFIILSSVYGQIGIGTTTPDNSAVLDVFANPTTPRGLLIPRLTTTARNNITSPATGLLIYNSQIDSFQYWDGARWTNLLAGNASDNDWERNNNYVYPVNITDDSVGIGTVTPGYRLDVVGKARVRGHLLLDDTGNNAVFVADSATATTTNYRGFIFRTYDVTNAYDGSQYTDLARLTTTGRMGFGALEPQGRLHIKAVGTNIPLFIAENDKDVTSDSVVIITERGNVGIGVASLPPMNKLHIKNAGFTKSIIESYGASPRAVFEFRGARGTYSTYSALQSGDLLGEVAFVGYGSGNFFASSYIRSVAETPFTSTHPSRIEFGTTNTNTPPTTKMVISSAGNVGIGTTAPNSYALLDVSATDKGILVPRLTNANRDAIAGLANTESGLLIYNTDVDSFQYWDGTRWTNLLAGGADDNDWTVDNGASVTYLTNTIHNVGIGTATPGAKLHVKGNAANIILETTSGEPYMSYLPWGSSGMQFSTGVQTSDTSFKIRNAAVGDLVTVHHSGVMSLLGTERIYRGAGWVSNATTTRSAFTGAQDIGFYGASGGHFRIVTGQQDRVHVGAGGNVGIGTTSPANKLHVEGGAITVRRDVASAGLYSYTYGGNSILALGGAGGTIASPATASGGQLLGSLSFRGYDGTLFREGAYIASRATGIFSGQTPANLIFYTTSSGSITPQERMRITDAGNVGIGTGTPASSALLDIFAGDKGILIPRVALTGATDNTTVVSPVNALLVYNTATAGTFPDDVIPGFYYWDASINRWIRVYDENSILPEDGDWDVIADTLRASGDSKYVMISDNAATTQNDARLRVHTESDSIGIMVEAIGPATPAYDMIGVESEVEGGKNFTVAINGVAVGGANDTVIGVRGEISSVGAVGAALVGEAVSNLNDVNIVGAYVEVDGSDGGTGQWLAGYVTDVTGAAAQNDTMQGFEGNLSGGEYMLGFRTDIVGDDANIQVLRGGDYSITGEANDFLGGQIVSLNGTEKTAESRGFEAYISNTGFAQGFFTEILPGPTTSVGDIFIGGEFRVLDTTTAKNAEVIGLMVNVEGAPGKTLAGRFEGGALWAIDSLFVGENKNIHNGGTDVFRVFINPTLAQEIRFINLPQEPTLDASADSVVLISDNSRLTKASIVDVVAAASGGTAKWSIGGDNVGAVGSLGTLDNFDVEFITNGLSRMQIFASGEVSVGDGAILPAGNLTVELDPVINPEATALHIQNDIGKSPTWNFVNSIHGIRNLISTDYATTPNAGTDVFGVKNDYIPGDYSHTYYGFYDTLIIGAATSPQYYSFYSASPDANNYFAGFVGIGDKPSEGLLTIKQTQFPGAAPLYIGDGTGNPYMYMNSSGQVGIGSVAIPTSPNVYVYNTTYDEGIYIEHFTSTANNSSGVRVNLGGNGNGNVAGIHTYINNSGTGIKRGLSTTINIPDNAGNIAYGASITLQGGGASYASNTYGAYVKYITSMQTSGIKYGFYAEGEDANYFSGNVGIGTTSPASKLHIFGGSITIDNGTAPYTLPLADGIGGQVLQTDGAGNVSWADPSSFGWSLTGNAGTTAGTNFLGTTDNIPLVIKTNNAERMRITSGGKVGIGTSAPTAQFHVYEDIFGGKSGPSVAIHNESGYADMEIISAGNYTRLFLGRVNNSLSSPLNLGVGDFIGALEFGSEITGLSGLTRTATIEALAEANYSVSDRSTALLFYTSDASSLQERMRINSLGNVGIGTSSPAEKLHIQGGTIRIDNGLGSSYTLPPADGIGGQVLQTDGAGNVSWADPSSFGWSLTGNAGTTAGTNFLGTTDNIPLVIKTNNAERMRIFSTGEIGIGVTSAPQYKLHIDGNIGVDKSGGSAFVNIRTFDNTLNSSLTLLRARGTNTAPTSVQAGDLLGKIIFRGRNNAGGYPEGASIQGIAEADFISSNSTALTFHTGTTVSLERMRISSTGNVGIGITTPVAHLHIRGAAATGGGDILLEKENAPANFTISSAQGTGQINIKSSGGTFATPIALLTNNLIGAINFIHYDGTNFLTSSAIKAEVGNTIATSRLIFVAGDGTERMRIHDNGNVGIGTTDPGVKLTLQESAGVPLLRFQTSPSAYFDISLNDNVGGYSNTSGILYFNSPLAASTETYMFGGEVLPDGDNTYNLGNPAKRWSTVYAQNGTSSTSDRRLKKNIKPLAYGLETVMQLKPVSYQWKSDTVEQETKLGFIAQDLLKVLPEVVDIGNDKNKTLGVYYSEIIPVLTKAIQEQQKQIEKLKAENEKLKKLETRLEKLEAENKELRSSNEEIERMKAELEELKTMLKQITGKE